jgi:hypothetical protein
MILVESSADINLSYTKFSQINLATENYRTPKILSNSSP